MKTNATYYEVQTHKPWWIYLIIAPMLVLSVWSFIQQIIFGRPFGQNPAPDWGVWLILLFCGIFLPWLLIQSKQIIAFDGTMVTASYFPFWKTKFRMDEIDTFYRRNFNPMRDFWGWGIRYGLSKKNKWIMAYVYFEETSGVQFEFKSGRVLLVGSRQTDQFLAALEQGKAK